MEIIVTNLILYITQILFYLGVAFATISYGVKLLRGG